MTTAQKQQNEKFFQSVIRMTKDGGFYLWPATGNVYTIRNGKMLGSRLAIQELNDIVTSTFHSNLETL